MPQLWKQNTYSLQMKKYSTHILWFLSTLLWMYLAFRAQSLTDEAIDIIKETQEVAQESIDIAKKYKAELIECQSVTNN